MQSDNSNSGMSNNKPSILTNDSPVLFSYHPADVVNILHSNLKARASDDEIMSLMYNQMNYYDVFR